LRPQLLYLSRNVVLVLLLEQGVIEPAEVSRLVDEPLTRRVFHADLRPLQLHEVRALHHAGDSLFIKVIQRAGLKLALINLEGLIVHLNAPDLRQLVRAEVQLLLMAAKLHQVECIQ